MCQLSRSVQCAFKSKNVIRLNMSWQHTIPKKDTKNKPLRLCSSNWTEVGHYTLLFCRWHVINVSRLKTCVLSNCSACSLNFFLVTLLLALPSWFAKALKKFSELKWKETKRKKENCKYLNPYMLGRKSWISFSVSS